MTPQKTIEAIGRCLRGQFPVLETLTDEELVALLSRYQAHYGLAFLMKRTVVTGIAMVRLLPNPDSSNTEPFHDSAGSVLWVDWVYAASERERNLLIEAALVRFPAITLVGFERGQRTKRNQLARFYPASVLHKLYGRKQQTRNSYRQAA